jgi:uncharacterized LabA/DUF88 family protein
MEYAAQSDTLILLSGDGDFDLLTQHVQQKYNTKVEVYGVEQLTAASLINSTTKFVPITSALLI